MKRKLGLLAICLCITTMSAFGQTVQATVGVGANNTILCQQTPPPSATAPVTVSCPTVTWNGARLTRALRAVGRLSAHAKWYEGQ